MSVFLPRKHSSCWPLPRLSGLSNSTPFRIESLTLGVGVGVRRPSPLSRVSWLHCTGLTKLEHKSQWETVMSCAGGQVLPGPHDPTLSVM